MTHTADRAAAWIYSGVWASVVALFKVPPDPPTLPTAGEQVRAIRPAPGYLRYLKFFFWLLLIPGDVLPIVGYVAITAALPILGILLAPLLLVAIVLPDIVTYVGIHLRYDTTWYVLTDRSLRIRRGIWMIQETTISFENVQNVEVQQGPVQRHFGISDVIVQTAGGGVAQGKGHSRSTSTGAHVAVLQGVDDAEAVRGLILDRVRRSRSAGLGDERATLPTIATPAATALSSTHIDVLREIRDTLGRIAGTEA